MSWNIEHAKYILAELHKDECGNQPGGRTLAY